MHLFNFVMARTSRKSSLGSVVMDITPGRSENSKRQFSESRLGTPNVAPEIAGIREPERREADFSAPETGNSLSIPFDDEMAI